MAVQLSLVHGGLTLRHATLPPLSLDVVLQTSAPSPTADWRAAEPTVISRDSGALRVDLSWSVLGHALHVQITIRNVSDGVVTLQSSAVHITGLAQWWAPSRPPRALRIAWCGAHSRSAASRSYVAPLPDGASVESWWVGAVSGSRGPSIVAGGLAFERFVTRTIATADTLTLEQPLEQWALAPRQALTLDPLRIALDAAAAYDALEAHADAVGAASGSRPSAPVSGWGSWGHWSERIDAGLMHEMVLGLDGSALLRDQIRLVQVDDGWSELLDTRRVSSSWRSNARFPSGVAPLAGIVARSGRVFGLWLIPFTVNAGSALLEAHPDWLVRGADGLPARIGDGGSYCIDPTHPGAARWLRALCADLRTWGAGYVKLDFLRALLAPDPGTGVDAFDTPRVHANARTRLEAYRAGLTLLREALGPDVTILACSAPIGATAGLADAQRIGPDIEPTWVGRLAGIRDAARATAANWFWHGRTWTNDADYLLVCENEALTRFWAMIVALSGGATVLSADLSTLPAWAEQLFAFVLPPTGAAARPVDLFASDDAPSRFTLACRRGDAAWTMVTLMNWTERPQRIVHTHDDMPTPARQHVWDAWRLQHRIVQGDIAAIVAPHDVAVLRITPVTEVPTVVGTDVHWAQGWHEFNRVLFEPATGRLVLDVADTCPRAGSAWIWVPAGWEPDDAVSSRAEGLLRVPIAPGRLIDTKFRRTPA